MNTAKKIIVSFIAISSISGITAMANQDIALQMKEWFEKNVQISSEQVQKTVENGVTQIKDTNVEDEKNNSSEIIESFKVNTINQSSSDVKNYSTTYQTRLNEAKAELEEKKIKSIGEQQEEDLNNEISTEVEDILAEVLGE